MRLPAPSKEDAPAPALQVFQLCLPENSEAFGGSFPDGFVSLPDGYPAAHSQKAWRAGRTGGLCRQKGGIAFRTHCAEFSICSAEGPEQNVVRSRKELIRICSGCPGTRTDKKRSEQAGPCLDQSQYAERQDQRHAGWFTFASSCQWQAANSNHGRVLHREYRAGPAQGNHPYCLFSALLLDSHCHLLARGNANRIFWLPLVRATSKPQGAHASWHG